MTKEAKEAAEALQKRREGAFASIKRSDAAATLKRIALDNVLEPNKSEVHQAIEAIAVLANGELAAAPAAPAPAS